MGRVKPSPSVAALIGDLVGSRTAVDRQALHARLAALLEQANDRFRPLGRLQVTVGDEFQGRFADVGSALTAAFWLRVQLAPEADVRHGIGWGPVAPLDDRVEDGPGWWAARAAIEAVAEQAANPGTRLARTAYRPAEAGDGPDPAAVNAALACRDQLVGQVSGRSLRLLRGLLDGVSQTRLAEQEGISGSAVSQRVRGDGLAVIIAASELLGEVR